MTVFSIPLVIGYIITIVFYCLFLQRTDVAGADGGGCAGRAASFRHVSRVVCQVYPTVDLRIVLGAVGRHWLPRPCSSHSLIPGQTELSGRPRHRDRA